jgi:hypothetical protein
VRDRVERVDFLSCGARPSGVSSGAAGNLQSPETEIFSQHSSSNAQGMHALHAFVASSGTGSRDASTANSHLSSRLASPLSATSAASSVAVHSGAVENGGLLAVERTGGHYVGLGPRSASPGDSVHALTAREADGMQQGKASVQLAGLSGAVEVLSSLSLPPMNLFLKCVWPMHDQFLCLPRIGSNVELGVF